MENKFQSTIDSDKFQSQIDSKMDSEQQDNEFFSSIINDPSKIKPKKMNEMYKSVVASFVEIEKNISSQPIDNKDLNELFDDITIITKNNIAFGGINDLENILTKAGID